MYYIYRITHNPTGRTYVGKRKSDYWDGYYGSGEHIKNAVKKYGVDQFSREILAEVDESEFDVCKLESDYIRSEWESGHGEFNHSSNSYGGNILEGMPPEMASKITSKSTDTKRSRYGDPCKNLHTKEVREKAAKSMVATQIVKYGSAMGQCHTSEVVAKRSNTLKERYGSAMGQCNTESAKLNRVLTNIARYGSAAGKLHTPEVVRKTNRKFKYITPEGDIKIAQRQYVKRYNLNWTLIGPVDE